MLAKRIEIIGKYTKDLEKVNRERIEQLWFSRYLNGHFKLPLRVLFNMANAMKIDVNDLVVEADERDELF